MFTISVLQITPPSGGRGANKKRVAKNGNPSEYFEKTKMELPYDYSLSHHQLLFIVFTIILCHKYGNSFY